MSERLKIIIAYTAICTLWGSTWLVIKLGLETMTPLLSAGLRFTVAGVVLFGIVKVKNIPVPWNSDTQWFYIVIALTSFSIPFGLVYWGEQKISSGLTSILFAVFPFCVAIMSTIFLPNEKLTTAKISGIVFGFTGIVTIFFNDIQFGTQIDQILGMSAIVFSAVIQAFSAVLIKKHGHSISPFIVSFVPMSLAALLLMAASVAVEDFSGMQFTAQAVFSVIFLAVFGSVATFVSYFWLLKRVEVVFLSLTSFVTPLIAVALGVIILNEKVSPQLFAGASLVLVGIVTANAPDIRQFLRSRFAQK